MYEMFKKRGMLPSEFIKIPLGEKVVIASFLAYEMKNENKDFCPLIGGGSGG